MILRKINNESELINFVLENSSDNYSTIFNERELTDLLYFENYEGELKDNIKSFRNKPKSYPVNVLISEKLYDCHNYLISSGILYIYDGENDESKAIV